MVALLGGRVLAFILARICLQAHFSDSLFAATEQTTFYGAFRFAPCEVLASLAASA